jgi:hypothetical protein
MTLQVGRWYWWSGSIRKLTASDGTFVDLLGATGCASLCAYHEITPDSLDEYQDEVSVLAVRRSPGPTPS